MTAMMQMTTLTTSSRAVGNMRNMDNPQSDGTPSTESGVHNYTEMSTVWYTASKLLHSREHHTSTSLKPAPAVENPSAWDDILLVSGEHQQLSSTITDVMHYVELVILPTSFILTLCNFMVFLHPRMRSTASKYIVCISLAQLVNLLILGLSEILGRTIPDPFDDYSFWFFTMYFGAYLNAVSRRGTYIVLCLVSGQRLYAVLRPLHVKSFVLSRYPVLFTSAAYAFTAVWHFYIPAKYKITGIDIGTKIMYKPLYSSLHRNNPEVAVGFSFATQILIIDFTLLTQLVLSLLTVWALRRHNLVASRVSSSASDDVKRRQERQMTVTILSATLAYVILSVPQAVHFQFASLYGEYSYDGRYKHLYRIVNAFAGKLAIFSYATDFLCFVAISSNYRAALGQIFGCDKMLSACKKENGVMSDEDPTTGEIIAVAEDLIQSEKWTVK